MNLLMCKLYLLCGIYAQSSSGQSVKDVFPTSIFDLRKTQFISVHSYFLFAGIPNIPVLPEAIVSTPHGHILSCFVSVTVELL